LPTPRRAGMSAWITCTDEDPVNRLDNGYHRRRIPTEVKKSRIHPLLSVKIRVTRGWDIFIFPSVGTLGGTANSPWAWSHFFNGN